MFHRNQTVLALAAAIAAACLGFLAAAAQAPAQAAKPPEPPVSSRRRLGFDIARPIRGLGGLYSVIRRQQGLFYFREAGQFQNNPVEPAA
jgi:hypothetical protein